ncbi:ABC transporter permease [Paenibacillus sp. 481]|uniref:ABC transporter permease n=1 Tax=Paenibacillus sp. 481 TaxID=2835869 RepID=UPI001E46D9C4|nr:ABC transporter permease [Paenibacillus sp. 481]UHA74849.1 ABC transporter permease [Paenibacillus sp. 481]
MNSIWIAQNFFRRMVSDRRTLIVTLGLPVVIVSFILVQLGNPDITKTEIRYVDADQTAWSAHLLSELERSFDLTEMKQVDELREAVTKQQKVGFIIHAGYGERLGKKEKPTVELLKMQENERSVALTMNVEQTTYELGKIAHVIRTAKLSPAEHDKAVTQMLGNLSSEQVQAEIVDYKLYVPSNLTQAMGITLMFMMFTSMSCVSVMLTDKQNYTMERMYAAPVRSYEITLGNFIGGFMFGSLQIILVLLVTRVGLNVDLGMTWWSQWLLLELFVLASFGFACLIGAIISNPANYSPVSIMAIMPSCMIGGCFWPAWIMKDYMQKVSYFFPQRWVLDAMERLAAGGSIASITMHISVLLLFALIFLGIGSVVLKPTKRGVV